MEAHFSLILLNPSNLAGSRTGGRVHFLCSCKENEPKETRPVHKPSFKNQMKVPSSLAKNRAAAELA